MKESLKEPKLTYALDTFGKMVYIGSVDRGLSCHCRCPKCNEPLVAKLGREGGRQAHFAHCKGSDCHGSYMTALHKLAEQIIEEEKAVMAPAYKEIGRQRLSFAKVEVEQRVERKDLQPDIVGVTEDGLRWIIDIRNTHEVDESKKAKLIESNITCLEIDVREQTLENLKSFILESEEKREWINNPNYDARIVEAKRKRVSKVEEYLLSCTELTIPAYEDFDSIKISIKEASVLSKTDDELFSQVKVLSSEGVPFVFNIGSYDILETDINKESLGECNELFIVTDNLSREGDINSSALDISWSYHCVTEKEREERAKAYRNNPKYDVRPSSDCSYECKYRPYNGECIYKKDMITLEGISHVVCNKEKRLKDENDYLQETPMSEKLPFEKFWTIKDYYKSLVSSDSYESEKGRFAKIIQCEIVCGQIILLYKDPVGVRTITPYHIVAISTDNGNLIRNELAVFTNKDSAMNSYNGRVSFLRNKMCSQPDNDLPF